MKNKTLNLIGLILMTVILTFVVLWSLSHRKQTPKNYIETISDDDLDSIENRHPYNKKF